MIEQFIKDKMRYKNTKSYDLKLGGENYVYITDFEDTLNYMEKLFHPQKELFENRGMNKRIDQLRVIYDLTANHSELSDIVQNIKKQYRMTGISYPTKNVPFEIYVVENLKVQVSSDGMGDDLHIIVEGHDHLTFLSCMNDDRIMKPSRHIREIIFRLLENNGFVCLHASAIEFDGKGVLIIGNSGAGKTTTSLGLAHFTQAGYLANDGVLVRREADGSLLAYGLPLPIGMNYGTLKAMGWTSIYNNYLTLPKPTEDSDWRNFNGKGKLRLLPSELQEITGIKLVPKINISTVLYPNIDSIRNKWDIYDCQPKISLIRENAYTPIHPVFRSDFLSKRKKSEEELFKNVEDVIGTLTSLPHYIVNHAAYDSCMELCLAVKKVIQGVKR